MNYIFNLLKRWSEYEVITQPETIWLPKLPSSAITTPKCLCYRPCSLELPCLLNSKFKNIEQECSFYSCWLGKKGNISLRSELLRLFVSIYSLKSIARGCSVPLLIRFSLMNLPSISYTNKKQSYQLHSLVILNNLKVWD